MKATGLILVVAACGGGSSASDAHDIDAFQIPATITIRGAASERSSAGHTPVAGVTVTAYQGQGQATPLASTTTDANGDYALTLPTHGSPLDVHLGTSSPAYADTYLELQTALFDNVNSISLDLFTPAAYAAAYASAGVPHDPDTALLEIAAFGGSPFDGVSITVQPAGTIVYTRDGVLDPTATIAVDGIGFVFDAVVGTTEIGTIASPPFVPASVEGVKGALTMTTLTPGIGAD